MSIENAVHAFGALAHPHRLNAFRLLVRNGPDGLPAGRIAKHLTRDLIGLLLADCCEGRSEICGHDVARSSCAEPA